MESLNNPAVLWFIAGFVFLLLEFIVPGLILFFFGAGAWIVALVLLFTDIPVNTQLMVFLGASLLSILLFRRTLRKKMWAGKLAKLGGLEDEFIGKTGVAETAIAPGRDGKVDFKGTSWNAQSEDYIEPGEPVRILRTESIVLIVKSTKQS